MWMGLPWKVAECDEKGRNLRTPAVKELREGIYKEA